MKTPSQDIWSSGYVGWNVLPNMQSIVPSIIYFEFSQQADNKRNLVLKKKNYICISSGIKQYIYNNNMPIW